MPYLQTPSGKYVEVPSGLSDDDAIKLAKDQFPKLYADVKKAEEGLIPSIKSGYESLKSAYSTAAAPLFGLSDEAVKKGIERSQAKRSETAKSKSWEDVQKAQEKYGLFGGEKPEEQGGVSSLLNMWRGQLGESLPQIGAVMGGARVGAGLGSLAGPIGTIGGGVLGALAASYPAFVGQNVERQAEEQEKAKENKPLDYGKAATAAVPQAALDVAETAFVLGRLGVGKLFASALPKLGVEKAELALVEASKRSLAGTVGRGVVAGEVVEIPTETAQAVLERWQAGLPLFDKDAQQEYVATAVGVAGPAAVFGGVGGVSRRSAARDRLQELQQTRDAQAAQQQAALQQQQQTAAAAQQAFQALPGAAPATAATKKMEALPAYGGTQTDIFGEVGGAYTPLQGQALPEGLETKQPEMTLQEEYRKVKAEGDRLESVVEKADKDGNNFAYNEARIQLNSLEAAQNELIKKAKDTGVVLDVDAELKAVQATAQRYKTKQQVIPAELLKKEQALQAQKVQQMQQAAGVAPGPQADLFDLPRQEGERTQAAAQIESEYVAPVPPTTLTPDKQSTQQQELERGYAEEQQRTQAAAQSESEYVAPVSPATLTPDTLFTQQQKLERADAEQKRKAAEKQQSIDTETQRVKRSEELEYKAAMERAEEQLKTPFRALALSKTKDSVLLRKRVAAMDAAVQQGGLTADAVTLLGLKLPEGIPTRALPGLETETGLRPKYDMNDPRQAALILPAIKTALDETNAAKIKLATEAASAGSMAPRNLYGAVIRKAPTSRLQDAVAKLEKRVKANPSSKRLATQLSNAQKALREAKGKVLYTVNGQLTATGQKIVALEAKSRILQRLVDAAKAAPKQEKTTSPLQARQEADSAAKEREQHLFDLANAIDSLRKGRNEEADVESLQAQAHKIKRDMLDAVVREAKARRKEFGSPALTQAEIDAVVNKLDKQFSKLIDNAPLSAAVRLPEENAPNKKTGSLKFAEEKINGLTRVQLASEITKLTSRVATLSNYVKRNKGIPKKLQQSLRKISGFKNLREAFARNTEPTPQELLQILQTQLNAFNADLVTLDKRIVDKQIKASGKPVEEEAQQQRKPGISLRQSLFEDKGFELRRGMTMGDTLRSELTKLRRDVGRGTYELSFPKKTGSAQYVKAEEFKSKVPKVEKVAADTAATPVKSEAAPAPETKTVPFETISDAVGALVSSARLTLQGTKTVKERIAQVVSDGLTNNEAITAILRKAQAVAEKGISREGLARLRLLIVSNRPDEVKKIQTKKDAAQKSKIEGLRNSVERLLKLNVEDPSNKQIVVMLRKARRAYKTVRDSNKKALAEKQNTPPTAEQLELQKRNAEKLAVKEEKQRKGKPTSEQQVVTNLEKTGIVSEPKLVGAVSRLQDAVAKLEERVEANPSSKRLAKQLSNAQRALRKAKTAESAVAQTDDSAKGQREDVAVELLARKRLEKTKLLAQAETLLYDLGGASVKTTIAELDNRINKIKNKEERLQEIGKKTLASDADVQYVGEQRGEALRGEAQFTQEKDPTIRQRMLLRASKQRAPLQPRNVADVIEALTQERRSLNKRKRAIKDADSDAKNLPKQIASIEAALKRFGYNVSSRVAPVVSISARQASEREAGIATYYEGRKSTNDNKLSQQTKDKQKLANQPSSTTTRQRGKPPATVPYVEKIKPQSFKQRLKNPVAYADQHGIEGEDRAIFLDYANAANLDRTEHREATEQDRGVDAKAAADVAARVKKALPKGINFVYAPTLKDASPEFLAAMYRKGLDFAKGAVMPDGTVVIIGEAHKTIADLEETIAHELIGHYGVDTVLGKERMQALVDRLFKQGDAHVADVATALNVFPDVETALAAKDALQNPEVRMAIVREMIAHAAEGRRVAPTFTEKVKTFVRDMIAAVRSYFRNSGLSEMAKRDAKEIQALIRESSRNLAAGRLGAYVSPDGTIAFRSKEGPRPAGMSAESWAMMHTVVAQDRSKIDEIRGNVMGLAGMTQFVDRYAPVWAALKKGVAGKKITDLEASQVRYDLSARDKIMNFTRLVAANGALEYKQKGTGANKYWMVETKNKDGANLVKVFKAIGESGLAEKDAGDMFTMYIAAQRVKNEKIGVAKLNFGKDKNGNQVLTEAKLQQFEREIAAMPRINTAFEKARGIYNDYNKGLVDFAEQAGALSKEKADALRATKDYIPFYRENPSGEIELILGRESSPIIVGNLIDQPHLHSLVGGDTAISNIFTSAVQNTNLLTDMALRNIATGSVVDTLRKLDMLETRKYKDKKTGEQKESLKIADTYKGADVIRFRKDGEDIAVRVKDTNNTMFEGIPPTLLVKGLEGVKTTMPKALELMGLPAQFLRRAVILSPMYPLRQVVKDSFSALGTSGANFIPIVDPFKNIYKSLTGTSREAALLESQGLLGGQVLAGGSKEALSTILRSVVSGKQSITGMLAYAEAKSMEADVGVRLSAYNSYIKQGLNEMEAWVAANEITDFNRRGVSPSVQWANTLYPFFNAQIQGLSVFVKAMTGNMPYNERLKIQEKFKQRVVAMAAFTIMYAMAMEDDEAYKNATPEQKLNNWFVRVPGFDEPLRIPIPFEFGLLAKAIPEAIYNSVAGDGDVAPIAQALVQLGINSIPGGSGKGIPQFLVPVVESITGKDLFTGADVESARMQSLDPAQRYKDTTTELAKVLGSMGIPGVSPVKVDQFIKGVGAQTLLSAVSLADAFIASPKVQQAEKKASQVAFFSSAFQPNDAGGIINRTYELMQDGEQAVNTYNKMYADGNPTEAEAYLNANMQRVLIGTSYGDFKKDMKQSTDAITEVKASDLSPREKRNRIDQLRKEQIDTARLYRDIIRKAA